MMMTVARYAETRGLSVATVKNHINKLELDLPTNPEDNRQRLISSENQRKLDASTRRSAPDEAKPVEAEVQRITPYQRDEETSMIIAEGAIVQAQIQSSQFTHESPLLAALKASIAQQAESNRVRYQEVVQGIHAQSDTSLAIEAARRLQLMEQAQKEAVEEFTTVQALKRQTLEELKLLSLGLSPTNTAPKSQSESASPPLSPEPQPDWL
jgi:hypothetical protein